MDTDTDIDVRPDAEDGAAAETGDAPRPMRRDALRNRALLIEAAREVFAKRGLEASLDDVAKQAGVGVGTAYRHFANKFDLAGAVVREAVQEIADEATRAAQHEDPWAGLVGFLEALLQRQTENRALREVMMGVHDHAAKSDEVHELLSGPIATLLARAKAAGAVGPDVESSDLGFVAVMLCQVAEVAGDIAPGIWRRYLPTLLGALRADGPPLPDVPLDRRAVPRRDLGAHGGHDPDGAEHPHRPALRRVSRAASGSAPRRRPRSSRAGAASPRRRRAARRGCRAGVAS